MNSRKFIISIPYSLAAKLFKEMKSRKADTIDDVVFFEVEKVCSPCEAGK